MKTAEGSLEILKGQFLFQSTFSFPLEGVVSLFGASGCGKTTFIRYLAGLEKKTKGNLKVGGKIWQDSSQKIFLPASKRDIGYVFQGRSLFSHLNVYDNLLYGLKRRGDLKEAKQDCEEAINRLKLGGLLKQRPWELSGGQYQKVALARACLSNPKILLMDEPFSSLDEVSKNESLSFLKKILKKKNIPTLYVGHQLKDVANICDSMILMDRGEIKRYGAINDLLTNLALPLAYRDEACSVLSAEVIGHDREFGLSHLRLKSGLLSIPKIRPKGTILKVGFFAKDVGLSGSLEKASSILNQLEAKVLETSGVDDAQMVVKCETGGQTLLARITRKSGAKLGITPGKKVFVKMKAISAFLQ